MRKQTFVLPLLLLPFASLLGCSNNANPSSPTPAQQAAIKTGKDDTMTRQMQAIDNNPNMPPQAKAAAKANIQQHQNMDLSAGHK